MCAAKLTAPVVLHAHSNLSAQQPPTLYSHADSCTEICPFIPSSFILYSSLVPSAYDRPQLALSSVPITPGLFFFVSHLHATYAYTHTHTHTHTHAHAHTHTHTHTHTATIKSNETVRLMYCLKLLEWKDLMGVFAWVYVSFISRFHFSGRCWGMLMEL